MQPPLTSSWWTANPYTFATPEPPPQPVTTKLLPGDVRTLVATIDGILANNPLSGAQRVTFNNVLAHLRGQEGALPPSIPERLVAWLDAMTNRAPEDMQRTGNALLDAIVLSGDINGCADAQRAMQSFTLTLAQFVEGGAAPAKADDSDAVEWIEPDASLFFSTGSEAGQLLLDAIEDIQNAHRCIDRGCPPPTRMLFDGPPGCGKTLAAKWLATQLNRPLAVVLLSRVISKWMGESGARFSAAAKQAHAKGAVLFVDELDTIGGHREEVEGGAGDHTAKMVGAINQTIDALPTDMVVVGASNLPRSIDPSVARRFETRIPFAFPDQPSREVMLRQWWALAPYSDEAFTEMVRRTDGRSGDALRRAAHAANRKALRRAESARIELADVVGSLSTLTKEAAIGDTTKTSGLVMVGR